MREQKGSAAALQSFENFLLEKGNIPLRDFYNHLFQMFFADCQWTNLTQKAQDVALGWQEADGAGFALRIEIAAPVAGLYPNRDDRHIFYRLLNDIEEGAPNAALWNRFEFKLATEKLAEITLWLDKLAGTTAGIEAEHLDRKGTTTVTNLTELRVIDNYEINMDGNDETDGGSERNFVKVRIEFAEWVRRSFNERILDLGIYPLLTESSRLKSQHIAAA